MEGFARVYKDIKTDGEVYRHNLVDTNSDDYKDVHAVAVQKAQSGSLVQILPNLHFDDEKYSELFDGAKATKCPDLKIDGVFTEVKRPIEALSDNKLNNCIRNCHKQANNIIIILPPDSKINLFRIKQIAKGRFKIYEDLQVIELKIDSKYIQFKRIDF